MKNKSLKFLLTALTLFSSLLFAHASIAQISKSPTQNSAQSVEDPDLKLSIKELRKKYPIGWLKNKYGDRNNKFCQENFGSDDAIFNWPCGMACKKHNELKNCPQSCYGSNSPKNLVCFFLQENSGPDFRTFSISEFKSAFAYYNDPAIKKNESDIRVEEILTTAFAYFLRNSEAQLNQEDTDLKKFLWSKKLNIKLSNPKECRSMQIRMKMFYQVDEINFCQNFSN